VFDAKGQLKKIGSANSGFWDIGLEEGKTNAAYYVSKDILLTSI